MSFTNVITRGYRDNTGATVSSTENITGDAQLNFSGQVAGSTTNHEIDWACVVLDLQSVSIYSDQAITILTNSTGSPQDTIALVAGQNIIWDLAFDGSGKIPFAGDVTKLYVTNAGSVTANIQIHSLVNL